MFAKGSEKRKKKPPSFTRHSSWGAKQTDEWHQAEGEKAVMRVPGANENKSRVEIYAIRRVLQDLVPEGCAGCVGGRGRGR